MLKDIGTSNNWESVEMIPGGWSSDRKYLVKTRDQILMLLRLSDIGQYDIKKKEYEIVTKYSKLGFVMSEPIDFGICNNGKNVYMLLTWVEGLVLESILPNLSELEQYQLGRTAGEILKKIHSQELDAVDVPKKTKKDRKRLQLSLYEESSLRVADDEAVIEYVKNNLDLIWREEPVYQHGDYHPGNLIYMNDGSIGVIDFNRWEVGDPYEEFYKLQFFGIESSIPYSIGQIDSYFNDNVPEEFWRTLAVYVAHSSLYSIKWAEKFGQDDVNSMVKRYHRALEDYSYFQDFIPRWYSDKYIKQQLYLSYSGA